MSELARLAMDRAWGADDPSAKCLPDRLVPKADAEDRNLTGKAPDRRDRNTGLTRGTRPRRDHDPVEFALINLIEGDRVVAKDLRFGSEFAEVLHEVVGEGIEVVDDQQHTQSPASAMATAFCNARDLFNVSSYSLDGCESATMPAP